jgi:heme-degrading monooxygenase HmoA
MFMAVFRNRKRIDIDDNAYGGDANRMEQLARAQSGFLAFKSYAAEDGEVVAISEWADEGAAQQWRRNVEHAAVQAKGRGEHYAEYTLFACSEPRVRRFVKAGR